MGTLVMLNGFPWQGSEEFPLGVEWIWDPTPLNRCLSCTARVLCAKNTLPFRIRSTRGGKSNGGTEVEGRDIKSQGENSSLSQVL